MKKNIKKQIGIFVFIVLFCIIIFEKNFRLTKGYLKNEDALNHMIDNLMQSENIEMNIKILLGDEYGIINLVLDGNIVIDTDTWEQEADFRLTDNITGAYLEGYYQFKDNVIVFDIPDLLNEPVEKLVSHRLEEGLIKEEINKLQVYELISDVITYNGREITDYKNNKDKTYQKWLYRYNAVIDLSELIDKILTKYFIVINQTIDFGPIIEFDDYSQLIGNIYLDIYIDDKLNLRKIEVLLQENYLPIIIEVNVTS